MKKFSLLLTTICISLFLNAQLSEGGTPLSQLAPQLKSTQEISEYSLKKLNFEKLHAQDKEMGVDNRYAVYTAKKIDIKEQGVKTELSSGTIWQYNIKSKRTFSLSLIFSEYKLPKGAKLFIYNKDLSKVYGAFTEKNNKEHESLAIADFPGNELIIEYYEPSNALFEGKIVVGKIGQSYKAIDDISLKSTDDLNIDVNCDEGDKYQLEKYSVAKMTFEVDNSGYLCSGALINNSNNDGTPYFLTANHCISTNESALTLVTRYNFENVACGGTTLEGQTLSGSTLKVTSGNTDVTLLLLDEKPDPEYYPYYAGYNYSDDDSVDYGIGIHHPGGKEKKISIDYNEIYSYPYTTSWEGNTTTPPNSHWLASFDRGITEGGSSGSPLFDANKRIIGQLHGGGDDYDLYGKISQSWNILKQYLDPSNTTTGNLDGYYPLSNKPKSHFYSDIINVCQNETVQLTDATSFSPTAWKWTFTPSSVSFKNGTTDESQFPVVTFNENTTYSISLETENSNGNTIKERSNYINAGNNMNVTILSTEDSLLCPNGFYSIRLIAEGAETYQWELTDTSNVMLFNPAEINSPIFDIWKNENSSLANNPSFSVKLIGNHGTCMDSSSIKYTMNSPINDNLENSIYIELGENGPFTNECATVQTNEPYPSGGDCESQIAWCDCDISEMLIENSVWFSFIGPESGIIGIDVPGFDNQIAIYEANDASDILSGDDSRYDIIAANDDYYGPEKDYSALIEQATVTPGKTYWLQVDGSACGAFGEFNVELYPNEISAKVNDNKIYTSDNSSFHIYPNPASELLNIQYKGNTDEIISIKMISIQGQVIHTYNQSEFNNREDISLNLPANITNGVYFLNIVTNKNTYINTISVISESR